MVADQSDFRLERPPLRSVRLAYYFPPIIGLLGLHSGVLFEAWREEYPEAREEPPKAAIDKASQAFAFVDDDDNFPTPYVSFFNEGLSKAVFFQADRFGISWRSDSSAGGEYAGFERLSTELELKFSAFTNHLRDWGLEVPGVALTECRYVNSIVETPLAQYAVDYFTGWAGVLANRYAPEESAAVRRHYHYGGDSKRPVWVQATGQRNDVLTISLTARSAAVDASRPSASLDDAHEAIISGFIESTSPAMRKEWGVL